MTKELQGATFDWEKIVELIDKEDEVVEDDHVYKKLFVGSVFSLYPSGKYYMPWACSNVTEEEALADQAWIEKISKELDDRGMWMESGEGDFCDIFFVKRVRFTTPEDIEHDEEY